ncbi:MAG: FAD-dependent oxidoreductase [Xanthobacteraceae bacterium]|nr:FAD-dependent oxidoreductase [Xanthobacteraceae bacterium]
MSEPLVIIGNGMAAARLADELSKRALGKYAVAVIGDEPRLAYNRVLLSSMLAGEVTSGDLELRPARWWRDHGVTLSYGHAAVAVDLDRRTVALADGRTVPFGKLVFATGSQAIRLNIPGADLEGVHTFRDSGDAEVLLRLAAGKKRIVVVGGGLLGLEAGYGLAKAGASATLVHLMDRLMERQLDPPAAALLHRLVEAKGIDVRLETSTARIIGTRRVEAVEFTGGERLDADAVIFAAGIRPNADLARQAGITVNRGIMVGDDLQTSAAGVYAIGECAEHRGTCYGLVEPAYEQARVLASVLARGEGAYAGSVVATNLKVSGVNVFSAGDFLGAGGGETLELRDDGLGTYKKLVVHDDRLTGAVLVGDTEHALWYLRLIRGGDNIGDIRPSLMFGPAEFERKAA